MTTFDEREHAFEDKFAHDQELRFRVHARRNRLFGLWAAERLGLAQAQAEAYATALAQADAAKFSDDAIVRRVLDDFTAKGVTVTALELQRQLEHLLPLAKQQVMGKS